MASPLSAELVRLEDAAADEQAHALVWRFGGPHDGISSASVGGGIGPVSWIANLGVARTYARTDLHDHATEVASRLGLAGAGSTLFTAADVQQRQTAKSGGVQAEATVGISKPTWAADEDNAFTSWGPGTINIVVQLPVGFDAGAAVSAVITATEAKTQALIEAGTPGTGTASDAIVICWPKGVPAEKFGGPRSEWGAHVARACYTAVKAGVNAAKTP